MIDEDACCFLSFQCRRSSFALTAGIRWTPPYLRILERTEKYILNSCSFHLTFSLPSSMLALVHIRFVLR
jgi:hypothetical protein